MDSPPEGRRAPVPVPVVQIDESAAAPRPPKRRSAAPLVGLLVAAAGVVIAAVVAVAFAVLGGRAEPASAPSGGAPEQGRAERDAGVSEPAEGPVAEAVVPVEVSTTEAVVEPAAAPAAPSCPDLSGHWAGTWGASTSRGTWTADFTQRPAAEGDGVELHGDIRVRGTSCGTGGHIVGRILDDCSVEFDPYRTGPCRVRYQATFEGEHMTGTLAATGFGMADSGRWRGTRRGPVASSEGD